MGKSCVKLLVGCNIRYKREKEFGGRTVEKLCKTIKKFKNIPCHQRRCKESRAGAA
jgi:hypothetical protein